MDHGGEMERSAKAAGGPEPLLEVLRRRYALGEITQDQLEAMKGALGLTDGKAVAAAAGSGLQKATARASSIQNELRKARLSHWCHVLFSIGLEAIAIGPALTLLSRPGRLCQSRFPGPASTPLRAPAFRLLIAPRR